MIKNIVLHIDKFSELIGKLTAWLVFVMAIIMFSVVVLRYGFDLGWIAMQESVTMLHALFFLMGIAYTQKHHGHVRVDVFFQKFSPRTKAIVDFIGILLLLLPVCGLIFWVSWDYVAFSWLISEKSNQTGGLPGVYIVKTFLLIMPTLVALQGITQAIKIQLWLKGEIKHLAPYDVENLELDKWK